MPQAININWMQACELQELPNDFVLISVNEEYEDLRPLKLDRKNERILTLVFSDVTGDAAHPNGRIHHPISEAQALEVIKFCAKYKDKHFLVHCAAGVSRSSAICLYISRTYGHSLRPNFWDVSHPNYQVIGRLTVFNHKHPELL